MKAMLARFRQASKLSGLVIVLLGVVLGTVLLVRGGPQS